MKAREVLFWTAMLSLLVCPWAAMAGEQVENLEDMVVTATRTEQAVEKIPAQVTVITREDIEASGAMTVPEVLRGVAGIFVTDLSGSGTNQTVDMGGFGENAGRHVAVVVDGRRINPMDQSGPHWPAIPLSSIERIEVLYGGNSVLYGDQAMGGVINLITKSPDPGIQVTSEVGFGSEGRQKVAAGLNYGGDGHGLVVQGSHYETEGYRDRSELEQESFSAKFNSDLGDRMAGTVELSAAKAEYQFPGSLYEQQMKQDRTQSTRAADEGEDRDTTLRTGLIADLGNAGEIDLGLSYRLEERRNVIYLNMDFDIDTVGLTAKYLLKNDFGGHGNLLTAGIDFYDTQYDGSAVTFTGTVYYDHTRQSMALYAQDEFNIFDSLVLNVGIRWEQPDTDLGFKGGTSTTYSSDDSEHAWNIGLAYAFMPGSKIYARAYRAFRYPVIDDYMNVTTGAMTTLEHEVSQGYEAGIRIKPMDTLVANFRVYTFDVEDEIIYNNLTWVNENHDTKHSGGEVDLRFQPVKWLALFGGAAYTDAEYTEKAFDGKTLTLVPEWKTNAGAELTCPLGFKYRFQYNYVGERYFGNDQDNSHKQMQSYDTVDMYLTYTYKQAEVFFNATNVFGETYADNGFYNSWNPADPYAYYPMPEASYYGGIRLKF